MPNEEDSDPLGHNPLGYRANREAIRAKARELAEAQLAGQESRVGTKRGPFSPEERKLRLERLVKLHVYNMTMELFVVDGMQAEANGR